MWESRGAYRALVGKPEGRNHLEDPGVDGRIILKCIFERLSGGNLDWIDIAQDSERNDEPSGFIKCREFLN
jgi:hypothetical protein